MIKAALLAISLALSLTAAAQTPVTLVPPDEIEELLMRMRGPDVATWHQFDTLHAAAMYSATRLGACSAYYECLGAIYKNATGRFAVGPVHSDYSADSVRSSTGAAPAGWHKVADFHSHPCVPEHLHRLFSLQDVAGLISTRMTGYMVDMCTGDVHEFIPGVTKQDEVLVPEAGNRWMTGGSIIGHVQAFKNEPTANEGI
jgi:hypothetical protein